MSLTLTGILFIIRNNHEIWFICHIYRSTVIKIKIHFGPEHITPAADRPDDLAQGAKCDRAGLEPLTFHAVTQSFNTTVKGWGGTMRHIVFSVNHVCRNMHMLSENNVSFVRGHDLQTFDSLKRGTVCATRVSAETGSVRRQDTTEEVTSKSKKKKTKHL